MLLCTCLTFCNYYDWWTHAYRIWNGTVCPSYINYCLKSEVSITLRCQLCSPVTQHFGSRTVWKAPLQTKQSLWKYGWFPKPPRAITKSTLLLSKEDTGKSIKNALYVLRCAKRHLSGQSNVEQWKNQARTLAIIELRLSEGISSIENSIKQI